MKPSAQQVIQITVILVIVMIVLLPISPWIAPLPHEDSGTFLFIGWRIAEGEVLYRDLWVNTAPLLLFLNALGYLLSNGSIWGIWILQVFFTTAGLSITLNSLAREYSLSTGIFCIGTILIAGSLLWRGNFTEEFALPFQMAIVALYVHAWRTTYPLRDGILLGITSALLLLLKQPLIMLVVAVGLLLLIEWVFDRDRRSVITRFVGITTGSGLAALGVVALYFASHRALANVIDVVFVFNTYYAGSITPQLLFNETWHGGALYTPSGLHVALIAAWLGTFLHLLRVRRFTAIDPLGRVLLIAIPLEVMATSITGPTNMAFDHYFVAWLPVLGLSAAYIFAKLQSVLAEPVPYVRTWVPAVTLAAVGLLPVLSRYQALRNPLPTSLPQSIEPTLSLIDQYSEEDDPILVWGYTPGIYYLSHHQAPTRFMFPFGIFMPGYSSEELQRDYVSSVLSDPPAVIIDTGKGISCLPSLNASTRADQVFDPAACYLSVELDTLFDFVSAHYERVETIEEGIGTGDYYVLIPEETP